MKANIFAVAVDKQDTGVCTPQPAETMGALKLGPDLDAAEFMDEPMWSFVQAIGWVAWRTPKTVRDHADRYRAAHLESRDTTEGAELNVFSPIRSTYLSWQSVRFRDDNPPLVPLEKATREFWRALLKGDLVANAIDLKTGMRRQIHRLEFQDLTLWEDRAHDAYLGTSYCEIPCEPLYRDPRVESARVLRHFPGDPNAGSGQAVAQSEPDVGRRSPAEGGARRKRKVSPTSAKIDAAVKAELENGGRIEGLRPGERNRRLIDRMKKQGLNPSEIPGERTFRTYFNGQAGKPAKSG